MARCIDLTGQKFGKLTVIKRANDIVETNGRHKTGWICQCDCGNVVTVRADCLRRKNESTKSCGCLRENSLKAAHKASTKHGQIGTRLYRIWVHMKERCQNPHCNSYKRYGNENKTVCDEWLNDFQAFYDWSMANGYRDDLTIDRKDNDKGYSPENCRWATPKEQANNRRNNRLITFNNETHTVAEWARIKGINYHTLLSRLNSPNYTIEKALSTP